MSRLSILKDGLGRFNEWDIVTCQDLSAGGTLFTYNEEIKIGWAFKFIIPFSLARAPIDCKGVAIRVAKAHRLYRVGVCFTQIDEEKRELINNTINKLYYKNILVSI